MCLQAEEGKLLIHGAETHLADSNGRSLLEAAVQHDGPADLRSQIREILRKSNTSFHPLVEAAEQVWFLFPVHMRS